MSAENPGSFDEWTHRNAELPREEALIRYSQELDSYRHKLAEEMGVSVEELHEIHPVDHVAHVGELALEYEMQQSGRA